jgi:hypothetical protein
VIKLLYFLPYVLLVVFGAVLGFIMGEMHYHSSWFQVILILFVLSFALLWGRNLYILFQTKNMRMVEKLLNKYRKRRPYIAFLIECINGNYEQAEKLLVSIKNEQQKTIGLTAIYIQKKQLEQAKIENQKIKNDEIRHYNNALIALLEGDQESFHLAKNQVKSEATKYILMAEEAYKKGDYTEAERLGNLAITKSAGLKRLVLLKSLEREQKNPNRETFF